MIASTVTWKKKGASLKIVNNSIALVGVVDAEAMLRNIERAGRTCYKSEAKITPDSSSEFVRAIIKRGHESVLEHEKITVRIICDRGISHEIVRHRIASYSQESTRYCDYSGDLEFINPYLAGECPEYLVWEHAMQESEKAYKALRGMGVSPQIARSVLPNSLKTEIVVTMNLRSWRNFLKLRMARDAHPQIRDIAYRILRMFSILLPTVFEDINMKETDG